MDRNVFGYIRFINEYGDIVIRTVYDFTESQNVLVEFIMVWNEAGKDLPTCVPMVLNKEGFFWATKQDEDGKNLYEKFPYEVKKLVHNVEYISED